MSGLSEKVAAEHQASLGFDDEIHCSCVNWTARFGVPEFEAHLIEATERAVRDAIATELADAQSHVFYPTVGNPDSLTGKLYMNGVGAGIEFATLLAREGTTP